MDNSINETKIEQAYIYMNSIGLLNTKYTLIDLKNQTNINEYLLSNIDYFILYILINLKDICNGVITKQLIRGYNERSGANIIVDEQLMNTIRKLYENLCITSRPSTASSRPSTASSRRGGFYKQRVIKVIKKY